MLKKTRVWAFLAGIGLALAAAFVLNAGRPPADVQVRASFQGLTDTGIPCTITNDDQGPYVTDGREIRVWISGDVGDLHFQSEHHSGRSLKVIFPPFNAAGLSRIPLLPRSTFSGSEPSTSLDTLGQRLTSLQ